MANFKANFRKPTGPPYGNAYGKVEASGPASGGLYYYHLDGHVSVADTGTNTFSNIANALDGDEGTSATVAGFPLVYNLVITGTNAPDSEVPIIQVECKGVYTLVDNSGGGSGQHWIMATGDDYLGPFDNSQGTPYTVLNTPVGGWTWSKLQTLYVVDALTTSGGLEGSVYAVKTYLFRVTT